MRHILACLLALVFPFANAVDVASAKPEAPPGQAKKITDPKVITELGKAALAAIEESAAAKKACIKAGKRSFNKEQIVTDPLAIRLSKATDAVGETQRAAANEFFSDPARRALPPFKDPDYAAWQGAMFGYPWRTGSNGASDACQLYGRKHKITWLIEVGGGTVTKR